MGQRPHLGQRPRAHRDNRAQPPQRPGPLARRVLQRLGGGQVQDDAPRRVQTVHKRVDEGAAGRAVRGRADVAKKDGAVHGRDEAGEQGGRVRGQQGDDGDGGGGGHPAEARKVGRQQPQPPPELQREQRDDDRARGGPRRVPGGDGALGIGVAGQLVAPRGARARRRAVRRQAVRREHRRGQPLGVAALVQRPRRPGGQVADGVDASAGGGRPGGGVAEGRRQRRAPAGGGRVGLGGRAPWWGRNGGWAWVSAHPMGWSAPQCGGEAGVGGARTVGGWGHASRPCEKNGGQQG